MIIGTPFIKITIQTLTKGNNTWIKIMFWRVFIDTNHKGFYNLGKKKIEKTEHVG